MRGFWKTKIGKILSYAIHEHNSGLGYISNRITFIKDALNSSRVRLEGDKEYINIITKYFNDIIKAKEKCKKSVDYIYEEIKKLNTHEEVALVCLIMRQEYFDEKGTIFQTFDETFKMAQAFVEKYPSNEWNEKWGVEKEYEDTIVEFIKEYTNDRD